MTNLLPNEVEKSSTGLKIWKTIVLFLVGWLGIKIVATGTEIIRCLCCGATLDDVLIFLTTDDVSKIPEIIKQALGTPRANMIVNSVVYFIVFAILLAIVNVDFKSLLKSYKKLWALFGAIIGLIAMLNFNWLYSFFVNLFYKISDNDNEASLNSIIVIYPVLSLIVFGFIGPIVEELTYRVGLFETLKKAFRSKVPAYIVTMLIFALIHFSFDSIAVLISTHEATYLINELLNLPLYLSAAFVFTFLYDKIGFAASVNCHIFNNVLSVGLTIIYSLL